MKPMTNLPRKSELPAGDTTAANLNRPREAVASGVAWGPIIAGAFAGAAVSLILLSLGAVFGLSVISPLSGVETAVTFGIGAAIWLIITQWLASGLGGYLAGRLRTKWVGMHTDEVFFRDTAHGFLTWAVATVLTAGIFASALSSAIGGGVQATATVASGAASGASEGAAEKPGALFDDWGYYSDSLFRSASTDISLTALSGTDDVRGEATRILAKGIRNGAVTEADRAYLIQLVTVNAGVSGAEASQRVDNVIAQVQADEQRVKQAAETVRKTSMQISLYLSLSLLIGAFIASVAAAAGGRYRDQYQ